MELLTPLGEDCCKLETGFLWTFQLGLFLLLILLFIAINHSCEYSYMQSRESSEETTELGHLLVTRNTGTYQVVSLFQIQNWQTCTHHPTHQICCSSLPRWAAPLSPSCFSNVSSAMMTPSPPWPRAAHPCRSGAVGLSRQGLGAKLERPAVASPNTLGDQIYLMVNGLVPSLTARAVGRARTGARG